MKRAVALVVAIGLVVGAVFVRRALDDGGTGDGADGRGGSSRVVICATEVASACEAERRDGGVFDGWRVDDEEPGTTAARLSEQKATDDSVWVVPQVWVEVVASNRAAAGLSPLPAASKSIARVGLAAVVPRDRAKALTERCGEQWSPSCVAEVAGQPWAAIGGSTTWGAIQIGLGSRDRTGWLLSAVSATAGRVGRTDFASNDLDADDGFDSWFEQFTAAPVSGRGNPVVTMLSAPGTYGVAYDLRLASVALAEQRGFAVRDAAPSDQPSVTADLVVVGGDDLDVAPLATALVGQGWKRPGDLRAAELPNGGTLQTLLDTK